MRVAFLAYENGAIYSLKGSKEARLILRAGKEKGEDAYE